MKPLALYNLITLMYLDRLEESLLILCDQMKHNSYKSKVYTMYPYSCQNFFHCLRFSMGKILIFSNNYRSILVHLRQESLSCHVENYFSE